MLRTKTAASALLGTSLLLTTAGGALAQSVELIYNSYLPPFNETFQIGIRDFAAAIEEESGGSITITIPDSSLAPANRQYEMVRDGIADLAVSGTDSVSQFVTLNFLGEYPGMAPTAEAGSVALWETYQEYFAEKNELPGVRVLSTHVLPGRDILSVNEGLVIETPDDLAGQRLWATARPFIEASEAMGAVPLDTEFGELQEFVARGDLDGLFISPGSAGSAGVMENVSQIARLPGGFGSVSFLVMISEDAWGRLNEEQQAAVTRAAEGLPRRLGAANDASELEVADQVEAIGISNLEYAAFADILSGQIDGWKERAAAAGLEDPQAAIDFYMSVVERETAGN